MKHHASTRFWEAYYVLPPEIQQLADENFALLKNNPRHLSLRFKKVGQFWSARVGARYRALAAESGDGFVWFWIGRHDEYDRLINR